MVAEVVILAEDVRHRTLIQRVLRKRGYSHHRIRISPWQPLFETPCLKFVLETYVNEVVALRSVRSRRSCALIVVLDADDQEVAERKAELDKRLTDASQAVRQDEEPIVIIVPRRNVETWLYFLEGNGVDEVTDYKPLCRSLENGECARKFADFVKGHLFSTTCPPSLKEACELELPRIP